MSKGERELLRILRDHPEASLERGGRALVLVRGDKRMNLGGLRDGFDRRRVQKFLEGRLP